MTEHPSDRDKAAKSGGMSLIDLEKMLADMEHEPQWRASANKCADYYDHKQASAERIDRSNDTGEPLVVINLIQRTINGALGQEAKTRLGWKCEADSNAFAEVATVLNEKLHEMQREAKTDIAISEAYASQLKTGIGWVEVSRNPDPLAYPYRIEAVHRNEVWWDWRSRLADKSDARWVCRQRWVDLDEAVAAMPKYRQLLEIGTHSGPITDSMARALSTTRDQFESIYETRRSFGRLEEEWLDHAGRKRIRVYSVYYRKPTQAVALAVGSRRVKFNPQNPLHQAALQMGGAKLVKGPSYEIRHAMFAGPYRLFDVPVRGRRFPLVPFICYQADDDRSPYGLVHGMIAPQDEFNERRSRLLWLLKAKQVFVDNDALDPKFNNFLDLAKEVMRPDAMFVLNANRRNARGLEVKVNQEMNAEQANVMRDAQQLIQEVPGLYNALLGSGRDGASSGVALNSLVEQSVTSLGETSDNYRMSRQAVGELAMELLIEDLSEPDMQVEVGTGRRLHVVTLNTVDERGIPTNIVEDATVRVALGDVPSTPAFKAQQQAFLAQALQTVGQDPAARAVLLPALIEAGELEHRHEYARWLRQQYGVPEPGEMDDDAIAQQQQAAAEQAQKQAAMQEAAIQAEMAHKQAQTRQADSAATLNEAKAAEIAQPPQATADDDIDAAIAEAMAA
jgi:hypothetical protein